MLAYIALVAAAVTIDPNVVTTIVNQQIQELEEFLLDILKQLLKRNIDDKLSNNEFTTFMIDNIPFLIMHEKYKIIL